ncbi:MAG: hypothetical protein H0U76_06140 [Ktedonobacteraceae bacterium]|nr:hypothetical protein [Ktedonobacteraceae bacterium]
MALRDDLRELENARTTALQVHSIAFLQMIAPETSPTVVQTMPLVWLDAEARPDVREVWKSYLEQGEGTHETRWLFDMFDPVHHTPCFYLRCTLTMAEASVEPITFYVAFPLATYTYLFEVMVQSAELSFLTDTVPEWVGQQTEKALEVTQEHLPALLDAVTKGFTVTISQVDLALSLRHWQHMKAANN